MVNPCYATMENRCQLSHQHQCTRKAPGNSLSIRIVCRGEGTNNNTSIITPEQQSDAPATHAPKPRKLRYVK
jgi:hypothetical protein